MLRRVAMLAALASCVAFVPRAPPLARPPVVLRVRSGGGDGGGENRNAFDPIAFLGCDIMGFPPERKWKGVRIGAYACCAGTLIPAAWVEFSDWIRPFSGRAAELFDAFP